LGFIAEKGSNLALRIKIRRSLAGYEWTMRLERLSSEAVTVNGVPVLADLASWTCLDGMVIDWVQTPEGPGFGVYDRSLQDQNLRLAGD
jgi:Fe-S cluster assembly iron-binding protein IscA